MTRPSRLLFVLDALLIAVAAFLGAHLYRLWAEEPGHGDTRRPIGPRPSTDRYRLTAVGPSRLRTPPETPAPAPLTDFAVVADRNLFSPTRSEAGPAASTPPMSARLRQGRGTPLRQGPEKPLLYGVVLGAAGGPRAYLRDPTANRLMRYTIGDAVGSSLIQEIRADRVILREPDGAVLEMLLRDPSKPRPAVTAPLIRMPVPVPPALRRPAAPPPRPTR